MAANAVQGEKIGNLNIPAVLVYRVKTTNLPNWEVTGGNLANPRKP